MRKESKLTTPPTDVAGGGRVPVEVTAQRLERVRGALLAWYDEAARELPWRSTGGRLPDPYHVWVSEVMLQQTRVATVRPYFDRWIARFPDVEALAKASRDEILKEWEGLGYYSRARNFHAAVREVADRHGGRIPDDPVAFRALPGVGRYTAGAVMSIAFGREEPVVDGNVRRVYARLADDPAPTEAEIWRFADELVRGPRPGELNQALMELGAMICVPRRPRCEDCPVRTWCGAAAAGTAAHRPERGSRPPPRREVHGVAIVVSPGGSVLLERRPETGRLGGMWEFPGAEPRVGESAERAAKRAGERAGGREVRIVRKLGTVSHAFTHVHVTYEAFLGTVDREGRANDDVAWQRKSGIARFAMPRAQRKIAALAEM